jgi:alpha-amylase
MRHFLGAIAPVICAAVAGVDALNAEEWQKQTIYQVVTDRFARAPSDDSGLGIISPTDSDADCPSPKQYCGGSWQGITDKLDYIQGMGFTAIWISPVIENTENASTEYSYHGYWPRNFYALNHHFGTEEDLIELSDALHARGMVSGLASLHMDRKLQANSLGSTSCLTSSLITSSHPAPVTPPTTACLPRSTRAGTSTARA